MNRKLMGAMTALTLLAGSSLAALAVENPMVGGAPMYDSKNIIENALNSKDHTTLVAAVKAAGLVETLSGKGPFTVFAPTNEAFDALQRGISEAMAAGRADRAAVPMVNLASIGLQQGELARVLAVTERGIAYCSDRDLDMVVAHLVVRRALALNAGAVVLAHNHPSGTVQPSRADEASE